MRAHLRTTPILDYDHPAIQRLIVERGWPELQYAARIGAVYDFVKDEIGFGYNESDEIAASKVLADGYAQCNTKTTLLMALLRAVGVPCRFHGATIHKRLQKGVVTGIFYRLAPDEIIHSWAEVMLDNQWVELEGVILDTGYLDGIRSTIADSGPLIGYGVGTENIADPPVAWRGTDTAIQKTGVNRDFGVFDDPDAFYRAHGVNLTGIRAMIFRKLVRHHMNRTVRTIRRKLLHSKSLR